MPPLVSVVIPTFNRAGLLPRAIDSVNRQTMPDWEILVVDDGSTDDTTGVLNGLKAKLGARLRVERQENTGSSAARNRGIELACGAFVGFLDSDDEWLPAKLERQLQLFEMAPRLGMVYCDSAFVDGEGIRHDSVLTEFAPHARRAIGSPIAEQMYECPQAFDVLLEEYFISTIVGLVRREVLNPPDRSPIRFRPSLTYAEEWLFYLQVAERCAVGFVDEPLVLHHHTPGSVSRIDPQRNHVGRYDTIRAMLGEFPSLSPARRRVVRGNLARACRQLAYDAERAGQWRMARDRWCEAMRYRPSSSDARHWVTAAWRTLVGRRSSNATSVEPRGGVGTRKASAT